jgi:uncharacterized pyridoxal phosphate-containing UPF0001 family protein
MPPLEESLARVRRRIEAASARSGRRPEEVRLIGVTKGVPEAAVLAAVRAGLEDLGENYVQELMAKRSAASEARWHFIGRLQRNKVSRVLDHADVVHTLEPGAATDRLAELAGTRPVECLIEVDFTGRPDRGARRPSPGPDDGSPSRGRSPPVVRPAARPS